MHGRFLNLSKITKSKRWKYFVPKLKKGDKAAISDKMNLICQSSFLNGSDKK